MFRIYSIPIKSDDTEIGASFNTDDKLSDLPIWVRSEKFEENHTLFCVIHGGAANGYKYFDGNYEVNIDDFIDPNISLFKILGVKTIYFVSCQGGKKLQKRYEIEGINVIQIIESRKNIMCKFSESHLHIFTDSKIITDVPDMYENNEMIEDLLKDLNIEITDLRSVISNKREDNNIADEREQENGSCINKV